MTDRPAANLPVQFRFAERLPPGEPSETPAGEAAASLTETSRQRTGSTRVTKIQRETTDDN